MTHYRKLERGELVKEGDGWFGSDDVFYRASHNTAQCTHVGDHNEYGNVFRPVEIIEAPSKSPEPPVHQVEDETWMISSGGHVVAKDYPSPLGGGIVCGEPGVGFAASQNHWPQRAKRICAGQEALKVFEALRTHSWPNAHAARECNRILAMLKD